MIPSPPPKVTLVGYSTPTFHSAPINPEAVSNGIRPTAAALGPLQVIAVIWKQSKTTQTLDDIIQEVSEMSDKELADLMEAVLSGVPVVEAVSFNFIIENASISWREQMVRHRVGTKPDSRVGVDWMAVEDVGDVADMSAWSQSMRLLDMSRFATERRYRTPDAIIHEGDAACEEWHNDMVAIEDMYAKWAKRGVPLEDARELIPLGATSRLSWTVNLRTLQHIVGKRGCTILQLGLWGPMINGMINEMATKIHPVFRTLVTPPCMKGEKYVGCIFPEDNARRLDGRDWNLPTCPLFIGRDETECGKEARKQYQQGTIRLLDEVNAEAQRRAVFWNRDPWTGKMSGGE